MSLLVKQMSRDQTPTSVNSRPNCLQFTCSFFENNYTKLAFATGWQRSTDLLQRDHPEIPHGIGMW